MAAALAMALFRCFGAGRTAVGKGDDSEAAGAEHAAIRVASAPYQGGGNLPHDATAETLKPATPYLKRTGDGRPFLQGSRCRTCGETFLGTRQHCARCHARDSMELVELGSHGKLYNYTVVHRSYPGTTVPFVSAIVDLETGGSLKGNLIDIDPDTLSFDMPVEVVFRGAEIANPAGRGFISHFFIPAKERQAA